MYPYCIWLPNWDDGVGFWFDEDRLQQKTRIINLVSSDCVTIGFSHLTHSHQRGTETHHALLCWAMLTHNKNARYGDCNNKWLKIYANGRIEEETDLHGKILIWNRQWPGQRAGKCSHASKSHGDRRVKTIRNT